MSESKFRHEDAGAETRGRGASRGGRRNDGYDAFISYSHEKDSVLAKALQSELQAFARPWYRPRALRIFRDETSLSATPGLWPTIQQALEVSDWFVLMASPVSAESKWVKDEVEWWLRHRSPDRILLALTDGEICWSGDDFDWSTTNAIPPLLSGVFSHEPFWIDLRKLRSIATLEQVDSKEQPRLGDIVAEFAAPIRGQDKDTLVGDHIRYQRKTRRLVQAVITALTGLLLVAVVAAAAAVAQANNANVQRQAALLQRDIATSRQLAANSELESGRDPQLAALLSSAAFVVHDTPEARTSMVHRLGDQASQRAHPQKFLSAHAGVVKTVAFSGDGRVLAAGGDKIVLWDAVAGTQLATLPGSARKLAFSPKGNMLAVCDQTKVTLWSIPQRAQIASFPCGPLGSAIAYSPDGKRLAVGGQDITTIVVWDIAKHVKLATLAMPPSPASPSEGLGIRALAFSPDGSLLIADSNYHGPVVWDVDKAQLALSLSASEQCGVLSIALSPDGGIIGAGCSAHSAMIMLWDARKGTELARMQADGDVDALHFSPDGNTLASADSANHVTLWDITKFTRIDTLKAHTDAVTDVAFSPDGQTLASSSDDTNIIRWKLGTRSPLSSTSLPDAGSPVAFNLSGNLLLAAFAKNRSNASVWDVIRRVQVAKLPSEDSPLGFTADGRVLVVHKGNFTVWDLAHGGRTALGVPPAAVSVGGGPYGARPVALSRDGREMATVIGDGTKLVVWDLGRDIQMATLPAPEGISSIAFGSDSKTLSAGESGGPIVVWDVPHAKKLAEFPVDTLGGSIVTVTSSPDGHTLASLQPAGQPQTPSGCFGCEVILWSLDRRARIATLAGHTFQPGDVAFSPDSQTVVSAAAGEIILWSVAQRAPMAKLILASGPLVYSPNGRILASTSRNNAITLWDTDPASWRRTLCTIADRDLTPAEWNAYLPERPYRHVCAN
ncbi:TIR domain-containing protein [Sphaerisporangium corydalis]|nr:TIR domain-containing protein [Sphaerisporangium corydalis]